MEEIIKQELVILTAHNSKQTQLISVLMEELASIYKYLCYVDGTEIQIYNQKMWTRLSKRHFFPISQCLSLEETLSLRLVSKSFNYLIIGIFSIYQYKYEERLRQINLEMQQVVQQDLPNLNTYSQEIKEVTDENCDMKIIRSTKNPSKIVLQVMTAALVVFGLAEKKENVTWELIQLFLGNHEDVYLRLTGLTYLSATDRQLRELEKNLEGVTLEKCQKEGVVLTLTFCRLSSIIDYCKLPIVKAQRNKARLPQEKRQIELSLQLLYKYV